jgi:excinuclease ABC subunit A
LRFLDSVGLGYLTLDRPAVTLSGGEAQRVRLATHIGLGLAGVCYVLDEPTIGLHPRDNDRLLEALIRLRDQGSSVLVVEHDESTIRHADWVIDLGPEAGSRGGQLVALGAPQQIADNPASITGRYLRGKASIGFPKRGGVDFKHPIKLTGVRTNNLKAIDVVIPTGALVCVTGVSGSGKSSLVTETLAPALLRKLQGTGPKPGPYDRLLGARYVDRVIEIDQRPIGRTPRSNPATYLGAFDEIRRVFTQTREARLRGYQPGRFSFNVKGGRCEQCQGQGIRKIEMHFLPDLEVECDACRGARFNRQTLEIRYRSKSIADVLAMRVADALEFFENFPVIQRLLATLEQVGLGYLTLGQSSTTLSGGEAQRVKLATELARTSTGKSVYILDEPTTGLHFADVQRLLEVLARLAELGNTLVVIEHNLDVIKSADYVIDLGPEGGEAGGQIVVTGTPEEVAACPASYTGQFLKEVFERRSGRRSTASASERRPD